MLRATIDLLAPPQKRGGEGSIVAPIDKKNLSFAVQILFFARSPGATAGGQAEAGRRTKRVGSIQANRSIGKEHSWYVSMSYRARGMLRLAQGPQASSVKTSGPLQCIGVRGSIRSVDPVERTYS